MYSIENELKILRQFVKTGHEPRYNHALDAYSLFLVIDILCEWEEMASQTFPNEPVYYAYAEFTGHTKEYFQDIESERISYLFRTIRNCWRRKFPCRWLMSIKIRLLYCCKQMTGEFVYCLQNYR